MYMFFSDISNKLDCPSMKKIKLALMVEEDMG